MIYVEKTCLVFPHDMIKNPEGFDAFANAFSKFTKAAAVTCRFHEEAIEHFGKGHFEEAKAFGWWFTSSVHPACHCGCFQK